MRAGRGAAQGPRDARSLQGDLCMYLNIMLLSGSLAVCTVAYAANTMKNSCRQVHPWSQQLRADTGSPLVHPLTIMESQVAGLGVKIRVSQTDLAVATKDQVEFVSTANLNAQQHTASLRLGAAMNSAT